MDLKTEGGGDPKRKGNNSKKRHELFNSTDTEMPEKVQEFVIILYHKTNSTFSFRAFSSKVLVISSHVVVIIIILPCFILGFSLISSLN